MLWLAATVSKPPESASAGNVRLRASATAPSIPSRSSMV